MSLGFNRSEEYGNKRKKLIPNPITYKNTEDKEVSKPRENPYQRCPECEDCDPSIPPVVWSTGTCRVGLLPDNIHQSIIEVDAEGNNLYFIYPNNRIIWMDKAWTFNRIKENPGYKIDMNVYSVESHFGYQTDYSYMTEFTKEKWFSLCVVINQQ